MPQERDPEREIARRGLMLVLSSPSGAGKTTLSRRCWRGRIRARSVGFGDDAAQRRPARSTGVIIISSTKRRFEAMATDGELLEWAEVFGNCYGTPREPVEKALSGRPRRAVRHRLAGHAAIAGEVRDDVVSVFVLPPSAAELEARGCVRARQDAEDRHRARMAKAIDEISPLGANMITS